MQEQFLIADYDNLTETNVASNRLVCNYLGIKTEILLSSELDCDKTLRRQFAIFDKCRILGGSKYINAIGGMKLYDFEEFRENGLELAFLKADDVIYPQFGKEFDPNLSIIDVMIFFSFLDWSIVVIIVVNSWTGNPVVYLSEEIGCNS